MDCSKKYDFIGYLDGSLPEIKRQDIELHLAQCSSCTYAVEKIKKSLEVIEWQKEIKANPFLFTRIRERMTVEEYIPLRSRILKPAIIAVIALFSVILGVTVGSYLSGTNNSTISSSAFYWNELEQENIEMTLLADK
jgi:hypothetical protein